MPRLEYYNRRIPLTEEEVTARALGVPVRHAYRPRAKTAAFTRRIRLVATELFAERGLDGVSLIEISRVAELGPSHLQYYYGKREHLLYDILWEHLEALLKTANETAARHQDTNGGPAWAHDLVVSLLRDVTGEARAAHRVLLHTLHVLPKVQRDALEQRLLYLRIALAQPLAIAAELEWADPRLEPVAHTVLAMLGEAALWIDPQDSAAQDAHAALIADMALAGTQIARAATPA